VTRPRLPGALREGHYGIVLALLVAGYLSTALATDTWVGVLTTLLYLAALVLALRTARLVRPLAWGLRLGVTVGSVGALVALLADPSDAVRGTVSLWLALVLGATVVLVVRHILRHRVVTLETIAGALSAYLVIGLMFAEIFTGMARFDGGSFFADGQPADPATVQYFSFTTLTTLGYGDYTAVTNTGRAVAVLEALGGQIFLVTLVARLVSAYRPGPAGAGTVVRRGRIRPRHPRRPPRAGTVTPRRRTRG
jgi:drug/metabolite transporter (DMT)-like permease